MKRGKFIVLEGIDGSGTTTQTARLASAVGARGIPVHTTCEPSKGPIGTQLRAILRGEQQLAPAATALLFAADRIDHLTREISPQLTNGVHVISDRYVLSSLAYQSLEVDRSFVAAINARAPAADLTLLVDVPVAIAEQRREARGGPVDLYDASDFQRRVRDAYLDEATRADVPILDGTGSADAVFQSIWQHVEPLL